jgi:hypothetical protein
MRVAPVLTSWGSLWQLLSDICTMAVRPCYPRDICVPAPSGSGLK